MNKSKDTNAPNTKPRSFGARIKEALSIRLGMHDKNLAPDAIDLSELSLTDIAKTCLKEKGENTKYDNATDMLERAVKATDFAYIIFDVIEQSVVKGFLEQEDTWPKWVYEYMLADFENMSEILYDNPVFKELKESISQKYVLKELIDRSGRTCFFDFPLFLKDILYYDLKFIIKKSREIGALMSQQIGSEVYQVFKYGYRNRWDKINFFSPDFKNVLVKGDGPPTASSLEEASLIMKTQTDKQGICLDNKPVYFLAPYSLKIDSEDFFHSAKTPDKHGDKSPNTFYESFIRIYDNRLDNIDPLTWYLVGGKEKGILLLYNKGHTTPCLESPPSIENDAIMYKIRFDYGVLAISSKNFVKVTAVNRARDT